MEIVFARRYSCTCCVLEKSLQVVHIAKMGKETKCASVIGILGEVCRCWLEMHEFPMSDVYYVGVTPATVCLG